MIETTLRCDDLILRPLEGLLLEGLLVGFDQ